MQNTQTTSFLHEAQKLGKASEKIKISDLNEAIESVNRITNSEVATKLHETPHESWPTSPLSIYCHDCRKIVPAGIKQLRRKTRKVCGLCNSVKISAGREEALISFYHLKEDSANKSETKNNK